MTTIYEDKVSFSKSKLWGSVLDFYQDEGRGAWDQKGVPLYITSTPFLARRWAEVVFQAYLNLKEQGQLDESEPFYILEPGAGAGRFAYLFMFFFTSAWNRCFPDVDPRGKWQYVMADLSSEVIELWKKHKYFEGFFERGVLDCAQFKAGSDEALTLQISEKTLKKGELKNPMAVLGGYLFDTLPHEAYAVKEGELKELKITVESEDTIENLGVSEFLNRFTYRWSTEPLSDSHALSNSKEAVNLLNDYKDSFSSRGEEVQFTLPSGAIQLMEFFEDFSKHGVLWLTGDQGFVSEEQLMQKQELTLGRHTTISCPVNYHALAKYWKQRGHLARINPEARFRFVIFGAWSGKMQKAYSSHESYFNLLMTYDPEDYWRQGSKVLENQDKISLADLYYFLKVGDWDPVNFFHLFDRIAELLEEASNSEKAKWHSVFWWVLNLFFPITEDEALPLVNLGALFGRMGSYDLAKEAFLRALTCNYERADAHFNLALIYLQEGDEKNSAIHLAVAEHLDPNFTLNQKQDESLNC